MIAVHRGAGMLAAGFGLLFALLANILTFRIFGGSYYEEHKWPKFSVLIMAGLACLVVGTVIKRKRKRDAHLEQQAIDSLSAKHEIGNLLAFSGPRDHLMFIPLQYWSIVYLCAAIIYALMGIFASAPLEKGKSSSSQAQTVVKQNMQTKPVPHQTAAAENSVNHKNLLFVDQTLEELVTHYPAPKDTFVKAYQYIKDGKTDAAKNSLRQVLSDPQAEVREKLWAWGALRQLGEKPPANVADEIQGVVMEVPVDKWIDTLAAYSDGRARYLNGKSGGLIIWDHVEENGLSTLAQNFITAAKPLVEKAPVYAKHQPAKEGVIRVTILTYGGVRIREGTHSDVIAGPHILSPVAYAGQDLLFALVEAAENQKP